MSANQIVIYTSIINYFIIDLALNQKKKSHRRHISSSVFIIFSS